MKRYVLLFAAATLALPVLFAPMPASAGEVQAAPAQEQVRRRVYHHRTYRPARPAYGHYYQRRYYRSYPYTYRPYYSYYYTPPIVYSPPPVVVQPAPVYVSEPVVMEQPVAVQPTPVVYETPAAATPVEEADDGRFGASFSVRFTGINESDTDLAFETIRGAGLLGAGGAIRFDLDNHWMLEMAVDILGSEDDQGVKQFSLPMSLSILAHLFPDSIIDPYGLAGLNLTLTEYDDPNYGEVEDYTQFGGQLGFGAELNLGRSFLITSDLRFLFMQPRPERDYAATNQTLDGGDVTIRDGAAQDPVVDLQPNESPDRVSTAFQFTLGAGWRF